MIPAARTCLIILLLASFGKATDVKAQTQSGAPKASATSTGSITGRVTLDASAPAAGVTVVLLASDFRRGPQQQSLAKAVTDQEGRYRLTNIGDGRYHLRPVAPTHVILDKVFQEEPGKIINLLNGETIEDINFRLVPGGVITGRVTDVGDQPVIGARVQLAVADENSQLARSRFFYDFSRFSTDDRGVYRIYGLPAGRFVVSAGDSKEMGVFRRGGGYYTRTFYGGASEQAEAKIIEVTPGKQMTDIDIRLTARAETFRATGRVVDAEGGQPLPGVLLAYGVLVPSGQGSRVSATGQAEPSDANGRFRLEGLQSGRYAVYVGSERNMMAEPSGETYSEPTIFEVTDTDASGIEVRVQRGSSLSGVVVIEGTSDKAVLGMLSQLKIGYMSAWSPAADVSRRGYASIAADGSFHLNGIAPEKISIHTINSFNDQTGYRRFSLRRIEHNGVQHDKEFEIKAGEHVEGVRVVLAYGTAKLRGQVNITGGTLPQDHRMFVVARHMESGGWGGQGEVDERGRFTIENMPEGEYELSVRVYPASSSAGRPMRGPLPTAKQNVTVTNGAESQVTLVLDLSGQAKEGTAP